MNKKMKELIQQERDKRSQELFNKNESELNLEEILKLDKYIHDISNPIWKDVVYNGESTNYQVSNIGEVYNKNTGLLLKQKTNRGGYKMFNLCMNGKKYTTTIHKLVANVFIPNPDNKPVINHINGKKDCNWVDNLERVTYKENTQHAIKYMLAPRIGIDNPNNKFTENQIHQICKLLEKGYEPTAINRIIDGSKSVANGIKCKRIWKDISSQYKIPFPESKLRPQELRDKMEILIKEGKSVKEIVKEVGLPDTSFERSYVSLYRKRFLKKLIMNRT